MIGKGRNTKRGIAKTSQLDQCYSPRNIVIHDAAWEIGRSMRERRVLFRTYNSSRVFDDQSVWPNGIWILLRCPLDLPYVLQRGTVFQPSGGAKVSCTPMAVAGGLNATAADDVPPRNGSPHGAEGEGSQHDMTRESWVAHVAMRQRPRMMREKSSRSSCSSCRFGRVPQGV